MFKPNDTVTIKLDEDDAKLLNGELQSFRVGRDQIIAHERKTSFVYKINDGDFSDVWYDSLNDAKQAAQDEADKYEMESADILIYMCVDASEYYADIEPSDYDMHSIMDKRTLGVV